MRYDTALEQLFEAQGDYFDRPASDLTASEIRAKLVSLASDFLASEKIKKLGELLTIKETPNGGIGVTDDLKYNGK